MPKQPRLVREFRKYIDAFPALLSELQRCELRSFSSLKDVPRVGGVYVIFDKGKAQYVGRAKDLKRRLGNHKRFVPGQSAFAFRLARQKTGNVRASYKSEGSRDQLMQNEKFRTAFRRAVEGIRKMSFRYVQVEEPTKQHLFEVYAYLAYRTPYNDFATH